MGSHRRSRPLDPNWDGIAKLLTCRMPSCNGKLKNHGNHWVCVKCGARFGRAWKRDPYGWGIK